MAERPYSRYTRANTRAAMYIQHIHAGYALVPWTITENGITVLNCKESSNTLQDIAKETKHTQDELVRYESAIATYYQHAKNPSYAPEILQTAIKAKRLREAVILAKSSDYYHYGLAEAHHLTLVICGLHDSYLHIPCWEMRINKRYKARETAISLTDPQFDKIRCTQFGHSILLAAYAKGNPDAIAFVENVHFPERSRFRLKREVEDFQRQTYRGRPLAFRDDMARQEVATKISNGLRQYHAQKRLHAV